MTNLRAAVLKMHLIKGNQAIRKQGDPLFCDNPRNIFMDESLHDKPCLMTFPQLCSWDFLKLSEQFVRMPQHGY